MELPKRGLWNTTKLPAIPTQSLRSCLISSWIPREGCQPVPPVEVTLLELLSAMRQRAHCLVSATGCRSRKQHDFTKSRAPIAAPGILYFDTLSSIQFSPELPLYSA